MRCAVVRKQSESWWSYRVTDTSTVRLQLEAGTWTLNTSHNQSVLLMWRALAVQYLRLGVGGTANEQGGHNFYVPPLTSDEQRRGSIRLHDATTGECGALSSVHRVNHGEDTQDPVSTQSASTT